MPIALETLRMLTSADAENAWRIIFFHALDTCSQPLPANFESEIVNRDRHLGALDLYLSAASWKLWHEYYSSVETTASAVTSWWQQNNLTGRAVLILDGLSLRETPWILQGARDRGLSITIKATGAELPGDTRTFAKAIGAGQRSSLENNKKSSALLLENAVTESCSSPWEDCSKLIGSHPNILFWHHWPDNRIHELGGQHGKGLIDLAREAKERLTDESFWDFIETLMTGRKLVITADHGYAAAGLFSEVGDSDQTAYMKSLFASGRFAATSEEPDAFWIPPIDLRFDSAHGHTRLVLGRRRWKSPGGYPSLTHGGLTVLEAAVPFIELSR